VQDFKTFLLTKDLTYSDKNCKAIPSCRSVADHTKRMRGKEKRERKHSQTPYSEKLSHGRVDSGHERKNYAKIEKMRTLAPCMHIELRGHIGDTTKVYIWS